MPGVVREIFNKNKDLYIIILLLIIAAYLRPFPAMGVMGRDETSYAFLIKHVLDGTFLSDYIFYAFHPLYAFICAPLAAVGVDPELAGKIVSFAVGVMLVIPVYLSGCILFSRLSAFIAGLLVAIYPRLILQAGWVMSEATYTFFLAMTFLFFVLFIERKILRYAIACGVFSAFTYLTRAEGAGIFALVFLVCLFFAFKQRTERWNILKSTIIMLAVFCVLAFPYVLALKHSTGEWKLTNKTFSQLITSVVESGNLDYEKTMYGNSAMDPGYVVKEALRYYPFRLWTLIKELPGFWGVAQCFFAFIAIAGIVAFNRGSKMLFYVPIVTVLLIIPFFPFHERILTPYAVLFYILTGEGVVIIDKYIQRMVHRPYFILSIVAISFFMLLYVIRIFEKKVNAPAQVFNPMAAEYTSYRDFGNEASKIVKPNARIMARYNMVAWYAGGEFVVFPDVEVDDFLKNIGQYHLDYIVIGPAEQGMRPSISGHISNAISGRIIDKRFTLIAKRYYLPFFEFTLVKVNAL